MQSVIELAGLPAEQQRCLQTAVRCQGLVYARGGGFVGLLFDVRELDGRYDYQSAVSPLIRLGLLSPGLISVYPTDAGIELYDSGRVARELAA